MTARTVRRVGWFRYTWIQFSSVIAEALVRLRGRFDRHLRDDRGITWPYTDPQPLSPPLEPLPKMRLYRLGDIWTGDQNRWSGTVTDDTSWDIPPLITKAGGLPLIVQAQLGAETVRDYVDHAFAGIPVSVPYLAA